MCDDLRAYIGAAVFLIAIACAYRAGYHARASAVTRRRERSALALESALVEVQAHIRSWVRISRSAVKAGEVSDPGAEREHE